MHGKCCLWPPVILFEEVIEQPALRPGCRCYNELTPRHHARGQCLVDLGIVYDRRLVAEECRNPEHEFAHIKNGDAYSVDTNLLQEGDKGIAVVLADTDAERGGYAHARDDHAPRRGIVREHPCGLRPFPFLIPSVAVQAAFWPSM